MNPTQDKKDPAMRQPLASINSTDGNRPSKLGDDESKPGLYIVATPIGNLGDLSYRAVAILKMADVIACEDTRVTGKLLKIYKISTQMTPYHDHSPPAVRARLVKELRGGKTVALVCDAGTPLVSDPGYKLVTAAVAANIFVTVAPGPAAPLAALVLSGLPTDRFFFAGYLPSKENTREKALAEISEIRATLIFLESPKRLVKSLSTMARLLGEREAVVARELTKIHEEVRRGPLSNLIAAYSDIDVLKGEIVIVVGPPGVCAVPEIDIDNLLVDALGNMSVRDAVAAVTLATGGARKEVYTRALALVRDKPVNG